MDPLSKFVKSIGTQHWRHAYEMLMDDPTAKSVRVATEYTYTDNKKSVGWEWILYRENGHVMRCVINNGAIIEDAPYDPAIYSNN